MNNLIAHELKTLQRKLTLLVSEHKKTKEELHQANEENKELRKLISKKQENIEHFQNSHKITKLANSLEVKETDNGELKQLLNQYIEEIDNCIIHLSEQ